MKEININLVDVMISTLYTCDCIEQIDARQQSLTFMLFQLFLYDGINQHEYYEIFNRLMIAGNKARTIQMHKDIERGCE